MRFKQVCSTMAQLGCTVYCGKFKPVDIVVIDKLILWLISWLKETVECHSVIK